MLQQQIRSLGKISVFILYIFEHVNYLFRFLYYHVNFLVVRSSLAPYLNLKIRQIFAKLQNAGSHILPQKKEKYMNCIYPIGKDEGFLF